MEPKKLSEQENIKKVRVWLGFKKDPFIMKKITFHKEETEDWKNEEIIEGVVYIFLPKGKKIENLLKKIN